MPGLRIVDLTKRFGDTIAVHNLTLEVRDGEIMTLLGPSGCGKTTTLRCIAGFVIPDAGDIYLGERRVTQLPPEQRDIGFVFQNYALWPHMTVYQNLAFGLELRRLPREEIQRRIDEALALVRLSGFEDRYPRQLSGGQQQRLCIARALAVNPDVLLMDEPCSALDPISTAKIEELLHSLKERLTVVIVTHNMQQAARVSDFTGFFLMGELIEYDATRRIFTNPQDRRTEDYITGRFG